MRTQRRNKQKMYYSLPGTIVPVYETDELGNIIYDVIDGENVPRPTGETKVTYATPKEFKGAVFSQLENAIVRAYGSDNSNNYATLVLSKSAKDKDGNSIKFTNGTLIWREKEIRYIGTDIDKSSADYKVAGVMTEELNENSYYLQMMDDSDNGTT